MILFRYEIECTLNPYPVELNMPFCSIDPGQLASDEANWSWSALFAIQIFEFLSTTWINKLIGWKFEVGMAS